MNIQHRDLDLARAELPKPPSIGYGLRDFWSMTPAQRSDILVDAIIDVHNWHILRNQAYRRAVESRGVGLQAKPEDMVLLLRQTAQTFKSYIDLLGTPFPQDKPVEFVHWLEGQLSLELPPDAVDQFSLRYRSLEALLKDIERIYGDFGFDILTSSGTSGRASIIMRNQHGISMTVESFYLSFQRYMGMQADHSAIFLMPRDTRIAMVRMASFSFRLVGLSEERLHYTIPFPAHPDQVRIRSGRAFRDGWKGLVERRLWNPLMNWANNHLATPMTVRKTIQLLKQAEASHEKVLIFGGWVHLHAIALALLEERRLIRLPVGSLIGTGGGMKELYPFTPAQIRADLENAIRLENNQPAPIRDVYGMAEGNWAAMQCEVGNYHLPPWIFAVVLDEDDRFIEKADSSGLLAFFDPVGGGDLFPSFFKTADRVRLVNGSLAFDESLECPCGATGAFLAENSIQRVDLMEEAGCAAQI